MNFGNMKYMLDGKYRELEEWMIFALHLGRHVKKYAFEKKKTFNIYIYLPNSLSFSYFLMHGMFDAQVEQLISDEIIIRRFEQLIAGDVVYYLDGGTWKRCSLEEEVVKNLISEGSQHLKVLNHGGVSDYIPSGKWETHVMIANRKFENIMNARVVKDIQRVTGNIKRIYSPKYITRQEVLNIPAAYVIGNRTEFKRYIDEITYLYKDIVFTSSTILQDGTKTNFCSIQWISKKDENTFEANNHEWVIFIGASKALAFMSEFENAGRIILDDRFEDWTTSANLRENIEQEILVSGAEVITSTFVEELCKEKVSIPKGVEILVWK
ncbi:hypothetical protein COF84_21085 [Bacillus wiedmannii]|uniref:hypothetical protein n=1 Tax=Bacillus wiedmannii TaxID=1890302 RepID=UPI000BFB213D|nr:hypothetical protein [Bacillus wiedmannii]PHF14579.1 hypothetical protein COF84_21085 [Bacillus wiedmannii]